MENRIILSSIYLIQGSMDQLLLIYGLILYIIFRILLGIGILSLIIIFVYFYMPRFLEKFVAPRWNASFKPKRKPTFKEGLKPSTQELPPKVQLDEQTGVYNIHFGTGRRLSNGLVKIHCDGVWYSSQPNPREKEQPLLLVKVERGKQTTPLGEISKISISWQCGGEGITFLTNFLIPDGRNFLIFEQEFPEDVRNTTLKSFETHSVSFPCFMNESPNKNVLAFENQPFSPPTYRIKFTSGPALFYDDDLNGFLLSAMNNFLISGISQIDNINCGLSGELETIPKGFIFRTIAYFGQGVHEIFEEWGNLLRQWHGAERRSPYFDEILSYMGYWTDNGAHYYYRTIPDLNYQETYIKLHEYIQEAGIPIGYYQFDSWWYPKANAWLRRPLNLIILKGGAVVWEPIKEMFPDGFAALQKVLQKPITCHGRWFAINSPYLEKYEFWTSTNLINRWAAPKSAQFWLDLFEKTKGWNLRMYEQDWLSSTFNTIKALRTDVEAARTWLLNINQGAAAYDMSIQLCMGTPGCWLHSLEMDRVTNVRSGPDYNARFPKTYLLVPQTQNALFLHALGLWPSIDVMCSSPGPKRFYKEKHSELMVLFANLSGGILGIGDPIGHVNKTLLMHTCRSDGLILKPDRPLIAIDLMFKRHSKYYISSTHSKKGENVWHYVLIVNFWPTRVQDKSFTLQDLNIEAPHAVYNYKTGVLKKISEDESSSLNLKKKNEFAYLILAPIKNGVTLIGTPDKFITCSNKFITDVLWSDSKLEFEVNNISLVSDLLLLFSDHKPSKILINAMVELDEKKEDLALNGVLSGWNYNKQNFKLKIKLSSEFGDQFKIQVQY